MQGIEVYLKKFENFGLEERVLIKKIINIIFEVSGVSVSEKQIQINNGVLRVNVAGPAKSEIFIKKNEIKKQLDKIVQIL